MKIDTIMGRRKMLQYIYSTIDSTFQTPTRKVDRNTLKTDTFIKSLKKITSNFSSKKFLKKPLQEMLKEFYDPSMDRESDDEDFRFNGVGSPRKSLKPKHSNRKLSHMTHVIGERSKSTKPEHKIHRSRNKLKGMSELISFQYCIYLLLYE